MDVEAGRRILGSSGKNLSGQAYQAVSEMIRRRVVRGGEVIVESKVADLLGVSRTPLREALQRLEGEGLVRKTANRSYVVRHVDLTEYLQSLSVRAILETEAAILSLGRIPQEKMDAARNEIAELITAEVFNREAHWRSDDTVHGLIMDFCGNAVMSQMIRSLRVTTHLFEIERIADRAEPDATEHLGLLDALQSGDPRKTKRAVQAHVASIKRFVLGTVA